VPDWLQSPFKSDVDLSITLLIVRQSAALLMGCLIALIYRLTSSPAPHSRGLMATLVLLTVLIGMVTSVIGDNIARAFSLVGALSIVRFRTVVEDTRDTAFVIFAVAVGMAVGAGYLKVPLVGIPITALAAFLFRSHDAGRSLRASLNAPDYLLTIRTGPAHNADAILSDAFKKHIESSILSGVATIRQGSAFERIYAVRLRSETSAAPLIADLNSIEGIQGAELRRQ